MSLESFFKKNRKLHLNEVEDYAETISDDKEFIRNVVRNYFNMQIVCVHHCWNRHDNRGLQN